MRHVVPVALTLLTSASIARSQTQVDESASSTPESATAQAPLPGPAYRAVPSQSDPKAAHDVAKTPAPTKPQLRPGAPYVDQLKRHWLISASAGYGTLLGNFSSDASIGDRLGGASLLGLEVGYGLGTHVELALAGDYVNSFGGAACPDCQARTVGIGPRLRYHLVGGTRFSPWMAYGFSFRRTEFDLSKSRATFDAVEPVRTELGGNWYLNSMVALGPALAASVARTIDTDSKGTGRWHVLLSAGLRVTFDPIGR